MINDRQWVEMSPESKALLYSLREEVIGQTLRDSIDRYRDDPLRTITKLTLSISAANIRRWYIEMPGTVDPSDFDLYKTKELRIVLFIQAGDIISAYQETV